MHSKLLIKPNGGARNSSVAHVLQYFDYEHLPEHLQTVSQRFHDLAFDLANNLPENPELTVSLRKLLEAKDAAVRATLTI